MSRRALVVEDDPDIVELLVHYLSADGWAVDALADGRRAPPRRPRPPHREVRRPSRAPDRQGVRAAGGARRGAGARALAAVPPRGGVGLLLRGRHAHRGRARAPAAGEDPRARAVDPHREDAGLPAERRAAMTLRLRGRMTVTAVAATATALVVVLALEGPDLHRRAVEQVRATLFAEARLMARVVAQPLAEGRPSGEIDALVDEAAR